MQMRRSLLFHNGVLLRDLLRHAVQPVALEILDFPGVYQLRQGGVQGHFGQDREVIPLGGLVGLALGKLEAHLH